MEGILENFGIELKKKWNCVKCGVEMNFEDKICPNCGAKNDCCG